MQQSPSKHSYPKFEESQHSNSLPEQSQQQGQQQQEFQYPYQYQYRKEQPCSPDQISSASTNKFESQSIAVMEINMDGQVQNAQQQQQLEPVNQIQQGIPMESQQQANGQGNLILFNYEVKQFLDSQNTFRNFCIFFLIFVSSMMVGRIIETEDILEGVPHLFDLINLCFCFYAINVTKSILQQRDFQSLRRTIKIIKISYLPHIIAILFLIFAELYYEGYIFYNEYEDDIDHHQKPEDEEENHKEEGHEEEHNYDDEHDDYNGDNYDDHHDGVRRFLVRVLKQSRRGSGGEGKRHSPYKFGKQYHKSGNQDDDSYIYVIRVLRIMVVLVLIMNFYFVWYKQRKQIRKAYEIQEKALQLQNGGAQKINQSD